MAARAVHSNAFETSKNSNFLVASMLIIIINLYRFSISFALYYWNAVSKQLSICSRKKASYSLHLANYRHWLKIICIDWMSAIRRKYNVSLAGAAIAFGIGSHYSSRHFRYEKKNGSHRAWEWKTNVTDRARRGRSAHQFDTVHLFEDCTKISRTVWSMSFVIPLQFILFSCLSACSTRMKQTTTTTKSVSGYFLRSQFFILVFSSIFAAIHLCCELWMKCQEYVFSVWYIIYFNDT